MPKFQPGNQAAVGRRPKTTLLTKLRDAVSPEWPHIVETIIGMAKAGDMQAATLLANRLAPVPKSVGPVVELDIDADLSPVQRMQAITAAALAGEVSPDQAKALADLIAIEVQLGELSAIEQRLKALEALRG